MDLLKYCGHPIPQIRHLALALAYLQSMFHRKDHIPYLLGTDNKKGMVGLHRYSMDHFYQNRMVPVIRDPQIALTSRLAGSKYVQYSLYRLYCIGIVNRMVSLYCIGIRSNGQWHTRLVSLVAWQTKVMKNVGQREGLAN